MGFYMYGWQVTQLGSNSNNSSKAGCFYWNLNNSSTDDNVNISTQLSLFLINLIYKAPASRQNIQQSPIQFGSPKNRDRRTGGEISK